MKQVRFKVSEKKYTMSVAGLSITIAVIALGIIDLALVVIGRGTISTMSTFLKNIGLTNPMFILTLGFVLGHLFGPMKEVVGDEKGKDQTIPTAGKGVQE